MGAFSKEELLILDKSIEQIESQILIGYEENADKDRMLYASCLNDEEKEELTKSQIKKQQKKLLKCPSNIAGYITTFINPNSFDTENESLDQYRERIIKNYVASTFVEVCESLLENKFKDITEIEAEEESFWELLIESQYYGVDCESIRDFIKYMIVADSLKGYKSIFESLDAERALEEYNKLIEADDNEIYKLLDDVRAKDHTELQLFNIIKEQTNLEPTSLKYFFKDIELYVSIEKDDYASNFSDTEVDQAIQRLKENGNSEDDLIRLGYITKHKSLGILNQKEGEIFTYINRERLLFPFEFYTIYQMQGIIKSELAKHETQPIDTESSATNKERLKVNLSVPQLALLFKMVTTLKPNVFDIKTEAELLRFISANFQTKSSNPEKGISENKLRILFNQPDDKAIEFWETNLRTMLYHLGKMKEF
jgi:hypothetical protein